MGIPNPDDILQAVDQPLPSNSPVISLYVPGPQIILRGLVTAPNVRALCAAILARGDRMRPKPYKPLTHLLLLGTESGDSAAAAVAEVIRDGGRPGTDVNLQMVSLLSNNITAQGCRYIGSSVVLGASSTLTRLVLDCNLFGDEGMYELWKGLRTNRNLQELSLASVGMSDRGCEYVADLLKSPISALEILDLSSNTFSGQALLQLMEAVRDNKKLKSLTLSNCGIHGGLPTEGNYTKGDGKYLLPPPPGVKGKKLEPPAGLPMPGPNKEHTWEVKLESLAKNHGIQFPNSNPGMQAVYQLAENMRLPSAQCALVEIDVTGNPLTTGDAELMYSAIYQHPEPKMTKIFLPMNVPPLLYSVLYKYPVTKKKRAAPKKK